MARLPRGVARLVALFIALAGAAATVVIWISTTPEHPKGPVAVVARGAASHDTASDAAGIEIAWSSFSEQDRKRIANEWHRVVRRLERRGNPLAIDLEEGDAIDEFRALVRSLTRMLTAAQGVVVARWQAPDRAFNIRGAARCPEAKAEGTRCIPLWGKRGPASLTGRERFVMGPVGAAALVRVNRTEDLASVATALRDLVARDRGTVALVLTARELSSTPERARDAALDTVRASATRAVKLLHRWRPDAETGWTLKALTQASAKAGVDSWLTIGADEILVVPRLSAVLRAGELVSEVNNHLAAQGQLEKISWVHQPETDRH